MNRIITILFLLLILPQMALAQGKLRGRITDQETGEPLLGANVIVVGTSYGAATDVNGEYIILNLIPDVYEVKASYIGYQAKSISNVRINIGLTTGLAVMKINSDLGYRPVTFSELTTDEQFWKGCESCVNYDILVRTERKHCLCTGMLFDPQKEKNGKSKQKQNMMNKLKSFKASVLLKRKIGNEGKEGKKGIIKL